MTVQPMMSARALGAMPGFIQMEAGTRGLLRAYSAAGLPAGIERDDSHYVPQRSVMEFLDQGARLVGDARIGLALAMHLTLAAYGVYGDYVLSAPTLADAIGRTRRALRWHSSRDELGIEDHGDLVAYTYRFASAARPCYENIAYGAAGVLFNLVRCYLGRHWRPERIELDVPRELGMARAQDTFGCRVEGGAQRIGIVFPRELLATTRPDEDRHASVTLADIRRSRSRGAPKRLPDVVHEVVRLQLLASNVDLESVAQRLELGPRTLQRQLDRNGLQFRNVVSQVRVERAKELLAERDLSITHIAAELGYSAPSHFARAFARETGLSPRQFRTAFATARA